MQSALAPYTSKDHILENIYMGELTATTFVTLDGVMQAPGGPDEDPVSEFAYGGWLVPFFDSVLGEEMSAIFAKASSFLLGRVTYDIFAGHWPYVDNADDPIANPLNNLPKYVASNSQSSFQWRNTSHIQNLEQDIEKLKKELTGELQVHGSHELLQTLIKLDLIDEYRIFVFPVVLGTGKRLFENGTEPRELSLVSSKTTTTGTVFNIYRRGGKLRRGSFALDSLNNNE